MPLRKSQRGRLTPLRVVMVILVLLSLNIAPLAFAAEKTGKADTNDKASTTAKKKAKEVKVDDAWYVYQHDARHSGQTKFKSPMKPTVLWVVPFGATGKPSTPMAVTKDGVAYVGIEVAPKAPEETTGSAEEASDNTSLGHSGVFAFGEGTKVLWVSGEKGSVTGPLAIGKDGTVYAVIGETLVAMDNKTGETDWKIALDGVSPGGVMLDEDGTIFAGTKGRTLYAVSKDGALRWTFKAESEIGSSPAIGSDGTVYFTTDDLTLYAVSATGSLKWKFKVAVKETTGLSSPSLAEDDTIYFTATRYEGTPGLELLYAIHPDGKLKWKFETNGKKSTMPSIAKDGTIVFGTTILNYTEDRSLTIGEAYVQAVNPDGTSKWAFKTRDDDFMGAPIIDGDGNIYMSASDWYLTCLTKSGTMRWRAKVGGRTSVGPEGNIYVAANSSVAAIADKDVLKAKRKDSQTDGAEQGGFGAGGAASFFIYIIPVAIAIGIGYLLKSRIGTKEEDETDKIETSGE